AMIDPLENNLFDLPDYENTEDETFPPLLPPTSPGKDDAEWAVANGEPDDNQQSQGKDKDSSVTRQRAVRRPIPKLDAQRLISERGLPALRHMFDNTKFKGKGHEAEDLKTLMRHMEHWAHRLFPKLQFDDFIDRVESLGNKKEVQVHAARLFLFMQYYKGSRIHLEDGGGESNGLDTATEDLRAGSAVIREELDSPSGTTLTEEQQERIKKNRQLALERRQAKLRCNSQSQQSELSASYPEEAFNTTTAQDLDDLIEDPQVTATKFAVADAEDRDAELESTSEKQ
ncbi:TIMELESS-interacting protein, partial [Tinamus guttatus]